MPPSPLPLALLAALALLSAAAGATPFSRSLLGAESETVDDDKASLSDAFPFLTDVGAKSRQFDLLNKTTSLRHWDPPTDGCAALLAAYPIGAAASVPNSVVLPNGDVTLYNPWTPWSCMNVRRKGGVKGRGGEDPNIKPTHAAPPPPLFVRACKCAPC